MRLRGKLCPVIIAGALAAVWALIPVSAQAATCSLVVNSQPTLVTVTVTPADNFGEAGGTASFVRTYDEGASVTLSAQDLSYSGYRFLGWWVDRAQVTTSRTLVLAMQTSHVAEARYAPPRLLTVTSGGVTGITATVSPADVGGYTSGQTPVAWTYRDGTPVTVRAAAAPSGLEWVGWELDGILQPPGADPMAIAVTMTTDHVLCARYQATAPRVVRRLVVNCNGPEVSIGVTPADVEGLAGGQTSFARLYPDGASVTLTAPDMSYSGYRWDGWYTGGARITTSRTTTLGMDAARTVTATYSAEPAILTVNSEGVYRAGVVAYPGDIYGGTGGTAPYQLIYLENSTVELHAAAAPPGCTFTGWIVDGEYVAPTSPLTLSLVMDRPHAVAAQYTPADTVVGQRLVVNAEGVDPGGLVVTTSTPDLEQLSAGYVPFARLFASGTAVTVAAPAPFASGYRFAEWLVDGQWATAEPVLSIVMDSSHTATARYAPPRTLTVNSNGIVGAAVEVVSPPSYGYVTPFQDSYVDGTTVTLRAPDAPAGYSFVGWLVDGTPVSPGPDPFLVSVVMDRDRGVSACYLQNEGASCLLTVNTSGAVDVGISATPADSYGAAWGESSFQLTYSPGTWVTLSAPVDYYPWYWSEWYVFWRWEVDGRLQPERATSVAVQMSAHHTATAWYIRCPEVTVNPAGAIGAAVGYWPPDLATGNTIGQMPFSLLYRPGTEAQLFAYDLPGHPFDHWNVDGADLGAGEDALLTVTDEHIATAYYLQPGWYDAKRLIVNTTGDAGITVSVQPLDLDGIGSGSASLLRLYRAGDAVSVVAPPTDPWYYDPYYTFRYWTIDGVRQPDGVAELAVTMDDHHTLTAYYEPAVTLRVMSAGTASVLVDAFPPDIQWESGGLTDFTRTYPYGSGVTLVAAEVPGQAFLHWELDGIAQAAGQTDLAVLMEGSHVATACYAVPAAHQAYGLTVNSTGLFGVSVDVSPLDLDELGAGSTTFQRTYQEGEAVTLVAPSSGYWWDFYRFRYWTLDGVPWPLGADTLELTIDASRTATAWYFPPRDLSVNAAGAGLAAAPVDIAPPDRDYRGGGITALVRTYVDATYVTLAAGDVVGHAFSRWEVDGVLLPLGQRDCAITMDAPHAATAWYDAMDGVSVGLTAPNGGGTYTAGSQQTISWDISGGTPPYQVGIRYSANGGASFDQSVASLTQPASGSGEYLWTVPNIDCAWARIRVSVTDAGSPPATAQDTSDGDFTIIPAGSRTLTVPDAVGGQGGEAMVTVTIDESAQVCGAQAVIAYDPTVLEVLGVVGPAGWGADWTAPVSGSASLIAWSPSMQSLPGGPAPVWRIRVRANGSIGFESSLVLSDVLISDAYGEPIDVVPGAPGTFTVVPQAGGFAVAVGDAGCQHAGVDAVHPMALDLTITALDDLGDPDPTYAGVVTLSSPAGGAQPAEVNLAGGLWQGAVQVFGSSATDGALTATDGAAAGESQLLAWRLKADVDGSASVNVLDLVRATNLALGRTPPEQPWPPFQNWAADVPDISGQVDSVVNVFDVLRIVNRTLGYTASSAAVRHASAVKVSLVRVDSSTWSVRVAGAEGIGGIQLELARGGAVRPGKLAAKAGWQFDSAPVGRVLRVLAFSPAASGLDVSDGELLRLTGVRGSPRLSRILVSDAAGGRVAVSAAGRGTQAAPASRELRRNRGRR